MHQYTNLNSDFGGLDPFARLTFSRLWTAQTMQVDADPFAVLKAWVSPEYQLELIDLQQSFGAIYA